MNPYSYDELKSMILKRLRPKDNVTAADVSAETAMMMSAFRQAGLVDDINEEALRLDILSTVNVWQPDASVLRGKKHVDWLPQRKAEITWGFWNRYRQYLEEEKNWPAAVTTKLHTITDSILGDIGNPAEKNGWDRRGMVVGEVQSGKTANYTGLICKAVDADYKLIIVLAGMTNDLRSQTQSRLDREFLGFESELGKLHGDGSVIGVGKIEDHGNLIAQPLTSSGKDADFRAKTSANLKLGGNPLLLVVKKNRSVLDRIQKWIESQAVTNPETGDKIVKGIPLLLLDDEADNASVNTKKPDEDPTSINRAIRKILKSFDQSAYVGYTATPFANIFIMPDDESADSIKQFGRDLFPKNFIYNISPPDNYIGAPTIFGFGNHLDDIEEVDESLPLIRSADDAQQVFIPRHNKMLEVDSLPESMIEALNAFFITCAARRVRGQKDVHNSMLIHVTRFNAVQEQIMQLVNEHLVHAQRMIEYRTGQQAEDYIKELKRLWEEDCLPTTEAVAACDETGLLQSLTWDEVLTELISAILKIQVRGINGEAKGVLDYDDNRQSGLHVIAVGGDKLSRGLTLENLSVSYYTRPAKNYDTLLQMGRWFGYRPGFLDLCRLYTTDELVGWYQHIAMASEELKREFQLMERSNLTPDDYGLRVRTSPDGLNITAANKLRHGQTMRVAFSGQLAQTTVFAKDEDIQKRNFANTSQWIESLGANTDEHGKSLVWLNRSAEEVLTFLSGYQTHPLARKADTGLLKKYIQKVNAYGELSNWTVVLVSSSTAKKDSHVGGHTIGLVRRSEAGADPASGEPSSLYMLRNANILNPPDEYIDLKLIGGYDAAYAETVKAWTAGLIKAKTEPKSASGPFVRAERPATNGLLLVYPLDPTEIDCPEGSKVGSPIIGIALSFPKGSRDEKVEYQVNNQYWQDRYGDDESDD